MTRRKRMLEDLDQDIRDHIERETQDNIERGMSPEEARYAALRKFGNVTQIKEERGQSGVLFGWSSYCRTSASASGCCINLQASQPSRY